MQHPAGPIAAAAQEGAPTPPTRPPRRSCCEIISIFLAIFGLILGISSLGVTTQDWRTSSYNHVYFEDTIHFCGFSGANAVAIASGAACLIVFGMASFILCCCAANVYQEQNDPTTAGGGNQALMIASCVTYAIMLVLVICAVMIGATAGGDVTPALVGIIVIASFVGWLLMMGHAQVSRINSRRQENDVREENYAVTPPAVVITPNAPPAIYDQPYEPDV